MPTDIQHEMIAQLRAVAAEVGLVVPSRVQLLFDDYARLMSGKALGTPVETVHMRDENFPYWIKLQNEDPSRPGVSIPAKASKVIEELKLNKFRDDGYSFDEGRARTLLDVPALLRNPDCVHINLRQACAEGGIEGKYLYMKQFGKDKRIKVAFTTTNPEGLAVLVSSFWTTRGWLRGFAQSPAEYTRQGTHCDCCRK